ncbi:hypothetical protein FRC02_004147 [Tulasnella sp. 418]|nr:hypothetical protein FRC02_004147 [Tulasnella sp. 418]
MPRASRTSARSRRIADEEEEAEVESSFNRKNSRSGRSRGQREVSPDEENSGEGQGDEENDAEDDEQLQTFDPSTFKDQPLIPRLAEDKLGGFIQDWLTLDNKIKETFPILNNIAGDVEETREENDKKTINKLEKAVRDLIDAKRELDIHRDVLSALQEQASKQRNLENTEERYEKALKSELNKYRSQTSRQKYANNKQFFKYKESVWIAKSDEAMPPVKGQIPAEDGDDESDDDDVEIGGATHSYICPISLKPFVTPVTSKICGHSYSREALQGYAAQNRQGATCPAHGCNKLISLAVCYNDTELEQRQKVALRRQRQRQKEVAQAEEMEVVE